MLKSLASLTVICLLPLLAACGTADVQTEETATKPNIIFIFADDMGYGDVGSFNASSKIDTPNIDALATQGIRFSDAHTAGSTCQPSRYGLLTGRYPLRLTRSYQEGLIAPERTTLATMLKSAGYKTAMVGKWHLGLVGEKNPIENTDLVGGPLDHGFDSFFGMPASLDIQPYYYIEGRRPALMPTADVADSIGTAPEGVTRKIQGPFYRGGKMSPGFDHTAVVGDFATRSEELIGKFSTDKDNPFFLYLALPAPHTPWLPEERFRGKSGAGDYGDYVLQVDDVVARIDVALAKAGIVEETLIIFSSDNGPVWYDANITEYGHDSAGGLAGMKGDVVEGGHRVPLLVRWPGKVAAGSNSNALVNLTDTLATFAELTGVKLKGGEGIDSISYLPHLLDNSHPSPRSIDIRIGSSSSNKRAHYSVRKGDWKLITGKGYGGFSDGNDPTLANNNPYEGRLYNLKEDVAEQNNLYGEHPEIVSELTADLDAFLASRKALKKRP